MRKSQLRAQRCTALYHATGPHFLMDQLPSSHRTLSYPLHAFVGHLSPEQMILLCQNIITFAKGLFGFQDTAFKQAATLVLVKALDCMQPDEAELASDLMMDFRFQTSEVQKAFLAGICHAPDMWVVLSSLQNYSLEADQQPQVYSTVLQRLASMPGAQLL